MFIRLLAFTTSLIAVDNFGFFFKLDKSYFILQKLALQFDVILKIEHIAACSVCGFQDRNIVAAEVMLNWIKGTLPRF